ncbi:hypothetical protein G4Y79_08620 [Phototrophicus methaneseepsis]|uniref:Uncharacterized protein n=1 Tax=Phototrophicus methaneseepsis TaxID=2710758 RepID=A0A7S8IG77_9CHLR|nr:hypothetical protein [Phototrophicus methaneseepsis]QPC84421.1 hypothetical protein G4Y79_08620 [Phototrophicus methaneseepsis]
MAINRQEFDSIMERATALVPYWARNTNPIVRRHLGLGGHTVPPEMRPLFIGFGVWSAIFILGAVWEPILHVTLLLFLASILLVPVAMLVYAHVLYTIAKAAAHNMQDEMKNKTINLLRTTPMTLNQIFLGKIAAAMWKRVDDLFLVAQIVVIFAPPILYSMYTSIWTPVDQPLLSVIMVLIALFVSLVRLLLEPIMIGALAVLVGVVAPNRGTAQSTTVALGAFYFLLLNLARHIPSVVGNANLVFLIDFVLPVVLPALMIYAFLRIAYRIVTAD